jgi:hypothetical protein
LRAERNNPKKEILMNRIVAIALLAGVAFTTGSCAKAQSAAIEVNVPFNFTINNTFLPAGTYTFGFDSMYPDLLIVRDRTMEVKAKDLGLRGSIDTRRPRTLIFHHYGSQYFLSEVRFGSASNGIFLPATRSERQARKVSQNEDLAFVSVH